MLQSRPRPPPGFSDPDAAKPLVLQPGSKAVWVGANYFGCVATVLADPSAKITGKGATSQGSYYVRVQVRVPMHIRRLQALCCLLTAGCAAQRSQTCRGVVLLAACGPHAVLCHGLASPVSYALLSATVSCPVLQPLHPELLLSEARARQVVQQYALHYVLSGQAARQLGVNPRLLGRLTGNIWVNDSCGERVDVGLAVKNAKQGLCVPGASHMCGCTSTVLGVFWVCPLERGVVPPPAATHLLRCIACGSTWYAHPKPLCAEHAAPVLCVPCPGCSDVQAQQ